MKLFELELRFDKHTLEVLHQADQVIGLARQPMDGAQPVVWATLRPFCTNYLSWPAEHGLYTASAADWQRGWVRPLAHEAAVPQQTYQLGRSGYFQQPQASPMPLSISQYRVENQWPHAPSAIFGLTQSIYLNGQLLPDQPATALIVPTADSAELTEPGEMLLFVGTDVVPGQVLAPLPVNFFAVQCLAGETQILRYGGGQFMIVNS